MVRVYTELRRRILDGELPPGVRLDPARLGQEMAASMTPIRDALHQLKGEGLVESWKHEGFWIADMGELVIRDRYLWCADVAVSGAGGDSVFGMISSTGFVVDAWRDGGASLCD